jgi:hypothetical protein
MMATRSSERRESPTALGGEGGHSGSRVAYRLLGTVRSSSVDRVGLLIASLLVAALLVALASVPGPR